MFSFFRKRSSCPLLKPNSFISLYCEIPFAFIFAQRRSYTIILASFLVFRIRYPFYVDNSPYTGYNAIVRFN